MRIERSILAFAGALVASVSIVPGAIASPSTRPAPVARPIVTMITPDLLRVDKQDKTNNLVIFAGMDAKTSARVNWGDADATESVRGTCKTSTALAHPDWCTVAVLHEYDAPGQYTITAAVGTTRSSKLVTISPAPTRWAPPSAWTQPANWSLLRSAATFFPCENVKWYFDRTGQPAAGGQIYSDVVPALAMISAETGLAFEETADLAQAALTFKWGDVGTHAGTGGGANGRGKVTFSPTHWWATDHWPGFGVVRQPNGSSAIGHGWLVLHEALHAIGLGHVNDRTSVMNPVSGATAFNAGDLEALHTIYRNNSCPVG